VRRPIRLAAVAAVLALGLAACGTNASIRTQAQTAPADTPTPALGNTVLTLQAAHSYQPVPQTAGGTDDYHCTLLDPHVTSDSMIVASQFFPESPEVHHAILFLVPPQAAAAARTEDNGGQGWTCFGESVLPGSGVAALARTPWLSAWAPGLGRQPAPAGTGTNLPAGSLVVMQIHYNLYAGKAPVRSKLVLETVPATTALKPLALDLLPAPPDIPCPAGVTAPLCDRAASMADVGQRFGSEMTAFDSIIERACGRDPNNPPASDTTTCTWPLNFTGQILRIGAHMHLLGKNMTVVLNPGTPQAHTLLDVQYNFHYQIAYDMSAPVQVSPGDRLQVTCTYDPSLHNTDPLLKNVPPRFVVWGDGSTDEMCLAIVAWVAP